jgi:hypothetical protein
LLFPLFLLLLSAFLLLLPPFFLFLFTFFFLLLLDFLLASLLLQLSLDLDLSPVLLDGLDVFWGSAGFLCITETLLFISRKRVRVFEGLRGALNILGRVCEIDCPFVLKRDGLRKVKLFAVQFGWSEVNVAVASAHTSFIGAKIRNVFWGWLTEALRVGSLQPSWFISEGHLIVALGPSFPIRLCNIIIDDSVLDVQRLMFPLKHLLECFDFLALRGLLRTNVKISIASTVVLFGPWIIWEVCAAVPGLVWLLCELPFQSSFFIANVGIEGFGRL